MRGGIQKPSVSRRETPIFSRPARFWATSSDPLSPIAVRLSKFLTGGGPGLVFNVNDTQLGTPAWPFAADLARRFQRLFDLSHCTSCATIFTASSRRAPRSSTTSAT
jgi:hypothetical protein